MDSFILQVDTSAQGSVILGIGNRDVEVANNEPTKGNELLHYLLDSLVKRPYVTQAEVVSAVFPHTSNQVAEYDLALSKWTVIWRQAGNGAKIPLFYVYYRNVNPVVLQYNKEYALYGSAYQFETEAKLALKNPRATAATFTRVMNLYPDFLPQFDTAAWVQARRAQLRQVYDTLYKAAAKF